jgi:hypothetical protein
MPIIFVVLFAGADPGQTQSEEDVEVSYLFKYLIFFAGVVQWQ